MRRNLSKFIFCVLKQLLKNCVRILNRLANAM
nr:MAG TPA: Nuclear receptor-interacting protein 1 repression 4 [Caudoviricetes sp.]